MAGERLNLEELINQAKQTLEGGNPDRAILLCQHIFKYFPRCLEATRVLGEAYTEKKLLDEADQLFVYVLASDPHDVLGYVDRGFIACERNQFEEAIVFYERALELDPNIEQLRSELLRLYKEQYGSGRAKLRLTRASLANHRLRDGFYAQAIDEYNAILRETPTRLDIQVGLLEAHWRNQDYPRAERLALDLLENHPYLIKANLILWHIYGVRRRQEKAAVYLDKAQALDPLHLVAERLFEDATTNDNALNYIAMLGTPTLPPPNWDKLESEAANASLLPKWVTADEATDRLLGLKGLDPNAEELADTQSTLKDLGGNDTNWLQRLLDESETDEKVEEEKAEALADLDQLRQGGEEASFDTLFEELSQPGFPVPDETSQTSEDLSEIFGAMEGDQARFDAFDLEMGDDMAKELEPMRFDPSVLLTETEAVPAPSPKGQPTIQFSLDDLDFDIPNMRVEDAPTFNPGSYGGTGLMDLFAEDDIEAFGLTDDNEGEKEPKAVAKPMPNLEGFEPKPTSDKPANVGELDDDSFLESLLSEPEQPGNYDFSLDLLDEEAAVVQEAAVAVPEKANPTSLEEHAFHKRDERGPIPDFVTGETPEPVVAAEVTESDIVNFNELDDLLGEASPEPIEQTPPPDLEAAIDSEAEIPGIRVNNQGADSTSAGDTSASKEIEDMPIKRGKPEEENDVFDWEKEELPDYLQPFAMDENEIEQFGLGTSNGPVADVSTSPARIRPRDQDTGGATPGDLPDWLNPAGSRTPPTPRPDMVDLSGGNRQAPPGDLPNWLDKTLEGQGQPSPSFPPLGDDFGLGDLQPFSPDEGDAFGGPSLSPPTPPPSYNQSPPAPPIRQSSQPTPFSPTERAFSEPPMMDDGGDLMPFSFDDLDSPGNFAKPAPSQPPAPPRQPTPPQPSYNPPPAQAFNFSGEFDDLMPFNPTDDGGAAPPAPPRPQPAPPQPTFNQQPKQPPAPSPRSSFPTPGGRSSNTDMGDFGDIEPFSLDFGEKPPTNPGRPADIAPFDPGNAEKSGFTDLGNMKLSDMDDIEPFNLGDFGAGEMKAPPRPSQPNQRAGTAPSFPDDLGNLDMEPFSFDSLDIPGLGNGPGSMRPDPNAYSPEPYYPTSGRRPRDPEPEMELEPGQARPFRKFSWLENRKKTNDLNNRNKTMRDGEEDSESPFARMSRRKQEFESNLPPAEEIKPLELEAEGVKYEEILSFEEIERRAALEEMAASGATASSQEQPFPLPELAANEPELSLNLDNAAFDLSLDESLGGTTPTQTMEDFHASQPPSQDLPMESFDLDMQPFDMADFGAEKPEFSLEQPEPEPFTLDFNEPSTQDDPFGLKIPEPPTMATSFDFGKELEQPEPFSFGDTEPALDVGTKTEQDLGIEQHFSQDFGLDQVEKAEPEPFSFDNFEQPDFDFGQNFEPKFTDPEPFSLELGEAAKTEPAPFSFDDLPEPNFDFGQTLEQKAPEPEVPDFDFGQPTKPEPPIFSFDELDEPELDFGKPADLEQPLNFGLEQAEKVELDTFPWENEKSTEKPVFGSPDLSAPTAQPDFAEFGNDLDFFATDEKRVTPEPIRISDFAKAEPKESGLMSFEEASKAFGINLDTPVAPVEEEAALPFEPDLPAFTLPVETAEPEPAVEAPEPSVVEVPQPPVVEAVVKPEVAVEKPISPPASNGAANTDLSAYLKRVADNPRDLTANLGLGNVYYEQQDYGQAINYFSTSLKVADKDTIGDIVNKLQNIATVQDTNPRFHRVLGDAYMKQGHYHWALSEYSKALERGSSKK